MKNHPEVYNALRDDHVVECYPQLIAEWNMNRYIDVKKIDNDPTEKSAGNDPELFPIESLVEPNRPDKGIVKARVGEGRISQSYKSKPDNSRYYVASPQDDYKYWTSPLESASTGGASGYALPAAGKVLIDVEYSKTIQVNKIVICAETTLGAPQTMQVRVRRGTTWYNVTAMGPAGFGVDGNGFGLPDDSGRIEYYFNGSSWGGTENRSAARDVDTPADNINAIRVNVTHMTRPDTFCSLIEISPRLERNLSQYVTSIDDNFEIAESSHLVPIGKASANNGNITFFNPLINDSDGDDGVITDEYEYSEGDSKGLLFNNDNPHSPFYGLLDDNVKFNLQYIYHIDGNTHPVQIFEMWGGVWAGQTSESVSLEVQDYSKFLMEAKPRKMMHLNLTVAEIVWRLCDSVGFSKYEVHRHDLNFPRPVPIWWNDGEKTVWEIFAELTETLQIAIYFDSYGVLQIKTKDKAFDEARLEAPDWVLRGEDSGAALADIVSMEKTAQYEVNHVTVNYQSTEFSEFNKGFPKQETVWEPGQQMSDDSEDESTSSTVVLRATPLRRRLDRGDTFLWIDSKEARHWPYEGIVNIQGELIRYSGKQYIWYTDSNSKKKTIINDADEFKDIYENKSGPAARSKNHFTGLLKITERGLWNTENKRHFVEANGYSVRKIKDGVRRTNRKGFRHMKKDSVVRLHNIKKSKKNYWLLATRGEADDAGYYHYGTCIRWPKASGKHGWAGLVFHNNGNDEDGYYVELRPSKYITPKNRNVQYECCFYTKKNGKIKRIAENQNRGQPLNIPHDLWVEVDVMVEKDVGPNNDHQVTVSINGKQAFVSTISGADRNTWGGKFGMFARGSTIAEFEYLYAIGRDERPASDNLSFLDKVSGGYIGRQWEREWVWRNRKDSRRTKKDRDKDKERFSAMLMDEFGPIVHEVREFDVSFEPSPVLHSKLYLTNDYQVVCPEYYSDSFGAKFILANAHRTNAVVHGEDTLRYARASKSVNQQLLIYGRNVIVKNAENVIAKDDNAIRRRGKVEAEIVSPWIQSKTHAKAIAEWIKNHWGGSTDEVTLEVFGNPLIEIGDVVSVYYPMHDMASATHKYFVVATSQGFDDGGLSTTLTIRRANL